MAGLGNIPSRSPYEVRAYSQELDKEWIQQGDHTVRIMP
jgi:hypothetical protein